jgi:acetyl-CoA acetyltransferase
VSGGRGRVAVVGVAESDLGKVAADVSPLDLMAQATRRALDDCGLKLSEVDGLFSAATQLREAPLQFAEYLRIKPRYFDGTHIGGSTFLAHVEHAQAAIQAGLCQVALIAYGSTQRLVSRSKANRREFNYYESSYRPFLPASSFALAASRHMHEFGTTRENLAEVAVAARKWALMNPVAWEKDPLTISDVLNSRMVGHPLTVRDCCLVTDGGGAMILTSAERARLLKKPPVYVLGTGTALSHASISNMPKLTVTAAAESGPKAFATAKLKPSDVDMVSLCDAFTITPILFLEDLGFCPKGEGGRFVSGGRIAPGGDLAVNTSGGGLSYCHPGMYSILVMIEAVRQVRGECGARQVPDCEVALAHGNGGIERREPVRVGLARAAQRAHERTVDVMRGARLGGAGSVRIARDQASNDRLQRIGLGGGEGLQRFKLRHRGRVPPSRLLLRNSCPWRERRAHNSRGARGADLLEQTAPRHITRRIVVRFARHGLPPRTIFRCLVTTTLHHLHRRTEGTVMTASGDSCRRRGHPSPSVRDPNRSSWAETDCSPPMAPC